MVALYKIVIKTLFGVITGFYLGSFYSHVVLNLSQSDFKLVIVEKVIEENHGTYSFDKITSFKLWILTLKRLTWNFHKLLLEK